MKYRNGTTNIGVICGFAVADGEKGLILHQTSCREMGMPMRLAEGVRGPTNDYEPVTVVVQLVPEDGQTQMVALHVTRMAKHMVPKTFQWNSRGWGISQSFYPFRKDKAGTLSDEVADQLAEQHDLPAWLSDAIAEDDSLAALLAGPSSNKHLQARVLVTGFLSGGAVVPQPREKSAHDYNRVMLTQPNDKHAVPTRLNPGTPGYWAILGMATRNAGVPITALLKPSPEVTLAEDGETVSSVTRDFLLLEANAVAPEDLAPDYQRSNSGTPAGVAEAM